MGLIKTNEYLHHTLIETSPQTFEFNMYNVLFVPPKSSTKINKIYIYSYDIYHPLYEIYVAQAPVHISNLFLQDNTLYKISADDNVQMYYEKEEVKA